MFMIFCMCVLEIDEGLCVFFMDWQKAFDRVNWTKLMQILKRTGIDWRERQLISNLDIDIFVDCNWVNTRWQWYSKHDQYIGQHK